jgi:flagellar hook-associated protein 2
MAGITSLGVGSGLDAESIVTKLMAVEKLPLTRLTTRTAGYNAKISAYGAISSALSSLKTTANALYSTKTNLLTTNVSDTNIASATSSSNASSGTYSLEVSQLAKSHSLSSRVASVSDIIGTGSLAITNGTNSFPITIDGTNNTLSGIRDAINASSQNTSVRANILTDTSGTRLVLTSKETGANNTISIAVTDNDGDDTDAYNALSNPTPGLSQLAFTAGANNLTQVQAGQNAQLKLDNVSLSFSSNTIIDAIPGVTLKLTKENAGAPATITIARDSSGLKTVADNFVKAYNELHSTIVKHTATTPSSKPSTSTTATTTAGPLTGDSTARTIDRQMRDTLRTVPAGITGDLTQLADVGISIDSSGVMSVDTTKFQKAVDSNFSGLQNMMDGYGKAVNTLINSLTDTNGVINARTDGLKDSIKLLDNQKEMLNNRLTSIEKRYRTRFSSLDTMISGMQSTSSYLSQQLARM